MFLELLMIAVPVVISGAVSAELARRSRRDGMRGFVFAASFPLALFVFTPVAARMGLFIPDILQNGKLVFFALCAVGPLRYLITFYAHKRAGLAATEAG
ncbi:MAG: hypothetical protein Kow0025_01260 [Thermodesulfovibrionales bacterium]